MEEEINPNRPEEGRPPPKGEPAAEHSFDELAKGLANRSLSRGDALRWSGRALAGGLLAAIPGIAWAQNIPQDPSGKGGPGLEQDSPQAPSGKGGPGLEQDSPQDPTGKGGAEPEQASPQTPTTQASQQSDKLRGCSTGLTRCPPAGCVDLSSDNNNCGSCGRICSGGTTCQGGSCACPSGQTDCGGTCVDTKTDPANCGGCGISCEPGTTCQNGLCSGVYCVDFTRSTTYCDAGERCCGSGVSQHCYNPETHICCTSFYCGYYYGPACEVCDLSSQSCCNGVCVDSGTPCP